MPNLSKKIAQPVESTRTSIRLLDGKTTIKLPVPPNPVHMLQGFLEKQLSKENPPNAAGIVEAPLLRRRSSAG